MVAKQKPFEDESGSDEGNRPGSIAALRQEASSMPVAIRKYLAPGVEAEEVEDLLTFVPGSIRSLSDWVERFTSRPEVTSVEFRIDRSGASPAVVLTAYTKTPDDDYIAYVEREFDWWFTSYAYPLDIIRPAIW